MGKIVDKDELEFLRKMAKEGNLESKMLPGEAGLGRLAGVDFPKSGARGLTESTTGLMDKAARAGLDVAKNTPPSIPGSNNAKIEALERLIGRVGKKGLAKGLGKAALGAVSGGLSLGAEAFDTEPIGPEYGSEDYETENYGSEVRELRRIGKDRSEATMARQPSMDEVTKEQSSINQNIEDMYPENQNREELEREAALKFKDQRFKRILEGFKK